jgi:hypothetical protein
MLIALGLAFFTSAFPLTTLEHLIIGVLLGIVSFAIVMILEKP